PSPFRLYTGCSKTTFEFLRGPTDIGTFFARKSRRKASLMSDQLKSNTTDGTVDGILKVLEEVAQRVDIVPSIEKPQKKNRSNVIAVSLKRHGQTFRITLNWVWQEYVSQSGPMLGTGYIEKQFNLRLRPEKSRDITL